MVHPVSSLDSSDYYAYRAVWGYVLTHHHGGYETVLFAVLIEKGTVRSLVAWQGDLKSQGIEINSDITLPTMLDHIAALSDNPSTPPESVHIQSLRQYCTDSLWMVKFHRDDAENTVRHQLQDYLYAKVESHCIVFVKLIPEISQDTLESLPDFFVGSLGANQEEESQKNPEEDTPEDGESTEGNEGENRVFHIQVRCNPVVDPIHGVPMRDIKEGNAIWVHLEEDSVIYSILRSQIPDFSGVTKSIVQEIIPHEERQMVKVRIAEGITGQLIVRDHVMVKSDQEVLVLEEMDKNSSEQMWFVLIATLGVLLLFLIIIIFIS